ncbi:MAG: hypothetical protein Q7R81_03375 [Candidatus Peregrinibacteria bacterium]|nr:hypothetical protein [Candidatus Peregrinibacteria bacterium]
MLLLKSVIIGCAFLLPSSAFAMRTTVWDFTGGQIPGHWDMRGLTSAEPIAEGMHIATQKEGRLMHRNTSPYRMEAITLTLGPMETTEAAFLWHVRGTPEGVLVQLPLVIAGSSEDHEFNINATAYPQWDPYTDYFGIALPPGADITIRKIEAKRWSPPEKFLEAWKSFWTFDGFRPYSINFLWGPMIAFNPIARARVFLTQPPAGWSANRVIYALLAIPLVYVFVQVFRSRSWFGAKRDATRKRAITILACSIAGMWIFYDLRMGLEFLNYAYTDYSTYISAAPEERAFRERARFYNFVEEVRPHIAGRMSYIFMTQYRWPYLGSIRYMTFPILPTDPTQSLKGVDTWVIYDRPDITVGSGGVLLLDGVAQSKPGRMLLQYDPTSFVFRTNPVP